MDLVNPSLRSTPSLFDFNPFRIKYHTLVLDALDEFDYKDKNYGYPEILLSGSVGSGKSLLAAHVGVKHCMENKGAQIAICRRALPDIKRTIFQTIKEHLDCEQLINGKDYFIREVNGDIEFRNGSKIIPLFWSDKKFTRIRSVPLSGAIFEEITENEEEDAQAFYEIKSRIGRVLHVKKPFLIAATNPDGPNHWVARYFIRDKSPSRFVFYSKTQDNPFLPPAYLAQLKRDMHPKLAMRLLEGLWVDLDGERLYYGYTTEKNYRDYSINWEEMGGDLTLTLDFNIGQKKPMSSCAFVRLRNELHFFKTIAIESANTWQALEAWKDYGLFKNIRTLYIAGDAAGSHRDTRGPFSDWDIVAKFMQQFPHIEVRWRVPKANPPIRTRQNIVNSLCANGQGVHRLFVYKDAKLLDEGLNGTKAKRGSTYDEDDSFFAQHVVAAAGYGCVAMTQTDAKIQFGRY